MKIVHLSVSWVLSIVEFELWELDIIISRSSHFVKNGLEEDTIFTTIKFDEAAVWQAKSYKLFQVEYAVLPVVTNLNMWFQNQRW